MGLLAASLICAVSRLTHAKSPLANDRERASLILAVTENRLSPALKDAFQRDAELFEKVIDLRQRRDRATDENTRRQLSRAANAELGPATDILFEMIERFFEIIDNGIALYEIGYRAARGDTGAALSAAVAAISSAIFVISLNAKTSRARWAAEAMTRVNGVQAKLARQQSEIFRLVRQSKAEAFLAIEKSFDGVTGGLLDDL